MEINTRQSLVALFKSRPHLRADLIQYLNDIEDAARIIQRFLLGRGDASDLLALCNTIDVWTSIRDRIILERDIELRRTSIIMPEWTSLDALVTRITDLSDLSRTIDHALVRKEYHNISVTADEGGSEVEDSATGNIPSTPSAQGGWTIKPE